MSQNPSAFHPAFRHVGAAAPAQRVTFAERLRPITQRIAWLNRPRRIFLLLAATWIAHCLDLRFTLIQAATTHFVELNPLANAFLGHSVEATALFKISMAACASALLWTVRKHAVAELAAWFMGATCLYLMVRWFVYFQMIVETPSWYAAAVATQ